MKMGLPRLMTTKYTKGMESTICALFRIFEYSACFVVNIFSWANWRTPRFPQKTCFSARFWAIAHQALASESKAVQLSPTIFFVVLTLTGLTDGMFFDN